MLGVRNKTIIGLKLTWKGSITWSIYSVRNKTIIGLKSMCNDGLSFFIVKLEIRL